jgi:Tfp pilus assembly protein PilP
MMTRAHLFVWATVLGVRLTAPLNGAQASSPSDPNPPAAQPRAPETFIYKAEGRRDPFVSLVSRGTDRKYERGGDRPAGLAGLATDELSVRGILRSRNGLLAMVQSPDGKNHVLRVNNKLLDGTVKAVTTQGVIILQDVSDPLSVVKQREVRKLLRGAEEGK